MKVILDENVPRPLGKFLGHHEVTTVQEQGWAGMKNGQLLREIDGKFDVFILGDKNMRYQQNLAGRKVALVELPTIRWPFLQPLIPSVVAAVDQARPGSYFVIEGL